MDLVSFLNQRLNLFFLLCFLCVSLLAPVPFSLSGEIVRRHRRPLPRPSFYVTDNLAPSFQPRLQPPNSTTPYSQTASTGETPSLSDFSV